uniref:protein RPN4-like isoform X2 n=1 Tax=Osmia lignaria TaxID=473952 RepID=UPI001478DDE7|nr:protein RPN4-like isoform X2 [Osmia lignaria]
MYYQNPWHLTYKNSKSLSLNTKEYKEQCYFEINDMINKEKDNFETYNVDDDTALHNFETVRTIPNILKNNSKLNKKIFSQLNETDENQNNVQIPFIYKNPFQENKCFKKETKCKYLSRKRKQGLGFTDVWNEYPSWNIDSSVDDKKKISNKSFHTSLKLEAPTKQRKLTCHTKQQDIKHEMSLLKTKQNENSCNIPTNYSSEYICLQEFECTDFQDSIDFSGNEIFSKFNYELYSDNNLTGSNMYMLNSNETYNSLSTTNNSDTFEKEYDLNSNKVDTSNEGYRSLTNESLAFSQHLEKDILLLNNNKLDWTCDSHCDHCLENCVSSWITANETINNAFQKDKMLAGIINPKAIHTDNEIDLDSTDIYDIYLATDTSSKADSTRTLSSENSIDNIDLSLPELASYCDEYNIVEEISKKAINSDETKKFNTLNDFDDVLLETDFDIPTPASGKEINEYPINISQSEKDYEYNCSNNKKFECSVCSLTFSKARTFAMHQAGAHGGMYVILCESCGTFFNRKYHFNRHLVHCNRLKKSFSCDMCMKAYRHKSSLSHHLKERHHIPYDRSPKFTCGVCNKDYRRFGAFENHLRKHHHAPGKLLTYCED